MNPEEQEYVPSTDHVQWYFVNGMLEANLGAKGVAEFKVSHPDTYEETRRNYEVLFDKWLHTTYQLRSGSGSGAAEPEKPKKVIDNATRFYRIDHIYRHVSNLNEELKKGFPKKKRIYFEMLQIMIRLTDQLEEILIKEKKDGTD